MEIITLRLGYGANCYILNRESHNEAVVIDPGAQGKRVAKILNDRRLVLKAIFLTHGHYDHISGVCELLECSAVTPKIFISSSEMDYTVFPFKLDLLKDLDLNHWDDDCCLKIADMEFNIVHTSGHSPGSVCIIKENKMFTGDLLFKGAIGRVDFIGGNAREMVKSLHKITKYPENTIIYPDHENSTILQQELDTNVYLKKLIGENPNGD